MSDHEHTEPGPELRRRAIAAGEARVAVMRRTYGAPIADVWDACTRPERLARWYVPVTGEFRVGGRIEQAMMGGGEMVRCEPPGLLVLALGPGGVDLIAVDEETTDLELQHATTLATHEIGGRIYENRWTLKRPTAPSGCARAAVPSVRVPEFASVRVWWRASVGVRGGRWG